jgi:hypothetical protein
MKNPLTQYPVVFPFFCLSEKGYANHHSYPEGIISDNFLLTSFSFPIVLKKFSSIYVEL